MRHRAGHHCTVQFTITNLLDNPSVGGLVLNTRDISERRQLEDQLVHQAFHDSLTSLANRALFKDRVDHALLRTDAPDPVGGGAVPRPRRLQGGQRQPRPRRRGPPAHPGRPSGCAPACGPSDTVARFGGDEFAVLIEDASDDTDVARWPSGSLDSLRQPFLVNGRELHVRGSMGIARMDSDVDGADQLLRNADLAMYRAKAAGRGGFERYDPEMHTELVAARPARGRPAPRAGGRGAVPPLPAHLRPRVGPDHRRRGPVPLEPPGPGAGPPDRVHPPGRGHRADPAPRRLGAARGLPAGGRLAAAQPDRDKPLTLNVNLSGRQLQHARGGRRRGPGASPRAACPPRRWSWR